MPYITGIQRIPLDKALEGVYPAINEPGDLAYVLYQLLQQFVARQGGNYRAYAGGIGVLYTTLQEFIRQSLNTYEDEKRKANGAL